MMIDINGCDFSAAGGYWGPCGYPKPNRNPIWR
jgi:hypothetical protein